MNGISVVIVSYNNKDTIIECLKAVVSQTRGFDEVFIIDNASTDHTQEEITAFLEVRERFPFLPPVFNAKNSGYPAAANQGLRRVSGEYVIVMNGDVVLPADFRVKLDEALSGDLAGGQIGTIAPKILDFEGKIDSAGLALTAFRRVRDIGRGEDDLGHHDHEKNVFGASGACAVYNREMLVSIRERTGFFDEDLFILLEDADLSWRQRRQGWDIVYRPSLVCRHKGGISHSKAKIAQAYMFSNRYLIIAKNESPAGFLFFAVSLFFYELPRLIFFVCSNPFAFKFMIRTVSLLPRMIRKRKKR